MSIHQRFQPECSIMADPSNGITFRTIQEAMPDYHIEADLIGGVLTAMPPPPADASPSWRRARLARVIEEVAARVPMDAAQGHLAGQLVVVQFLADDMLGRITAPGLALAERRLVSRTADDLLRSVVRLERALERRQMRVMPFRDVGAVGGFDLDALDGVWCRGTPAAADPVPPPAAPEPAAALVPGTPEPARPQTEGAAAVIGQAAGAGTPNGHAGAHHACVTLEQGDSWSLEVWPASAGASVGPSPAARDKLARPTVTAGAAMAERAATDRPGSRAGSALGLARGTEGPSPDLGGTRGPRIAA
jgi:hypothetical protein